MEQDPTKSPPVVPRRLINILAVMDRFRAEAERKGDRDFADALRQCALNMTGGNLNCPIGMLVIEESVRIGKPLGSFLMAPPPSTAESLMSSGKQAESPGVITQTLKAMEWRNTFLKLWTFLKEEAKRSGDKDCLSALEEAEDLTQNHKCPVRELIVQSLWHGGKP